MDALPSVAAMAPAIRSRRREWSEECSWMTSVGWRDGATIVRSARLFEIQFSRHAPVQFTMHRSR